MKFNFLKSALLLLLLPVSGKFCLAGCTGNPKAEEDQEYDIKASELKCRDPFIFYHRPTDTYYLHVNGGGKLSCYTSKDLEKWKFSGHSFIPPQDFWGEKDFWAPDMYEYKGKFYIFATFSGEGYKRGTSILVSDNPEGPFVPLVNGPVTPINHQCLDGSLFIDTDGSPWMIYCREWLEVGDGQVCAIRLSDDLKENIGKPIVLFKASSAPWVGDIKSTTSIKGKVTDAPFIIRKEDGKLLMTWSSFTKGKGYAIGQAFSDGKIEGPWTQEVTPLKTGGGHAMLFKNKHGQMMISYHAPNIAPSFLTLQKAYLYEGKLLIE